MGRHVAAASEDADRRGGDGKNMERSPRPVDVAVSRRPGEDPEGVDSQLDAAIKALLEQIAPKR